MNPYAAAASQTRAWLDTHFDESGRCILDPEDSRFYYKAPQLLVMAGLRTKAGRVAKYVRDHFIDEQGGLTGPPAFGLENRVYAMGWLTFGAVATERFDLSTALAGRLLVMQDAHSGGIVLPDADAGEEVGEVCFTAGVGMGLAAAGKLDAARLVADRMVTMLDVQPEPGRYYNRFRRDGSVVARPARAAWQKMYDLAEPEQRPANYATVVLALVWTARATGERHYLEAAQRYVDMVYAHQADPAHFGRATKFGWAMLALYEDTGNPQLLAHARHLGDVLLTHQSDDGLWDSRPVPATPAAPHERLAASADCASTISSLAGLPLV